MAKKGDKRKVTKEWLSVFTELSPYHQDKLYKIVGPILIGIEIVNNNFFDSYQPHFVVYPLWKNDLNTCLSVPIMFYGIKNNRGSVFDVSYEDNDGYFNEMVESVYQQIPISLFGNVRLNSIYEFIYYFFQDKINCTNSVTIANIYDLKLRASLYINNYDTNIILDEILKKSKQWDFENLKKIHGDFNDWYQNLKNITNNREHYISIVNQNKNDEKLEKLFKSELMQDYISPSIIINNFTSGLFRKITKK